MSGSCFWLLSLVTFYLNNTFFYDPKIFTWDNICHHVEQIFLNNILFGCELWTEPSYFATQKKLKNYQTLVAKKRNKWPKLVAIKKATNFGFVPDYFVLWLREIAMFKRRSVDFKTISVPFTCTHINVLCVAIVTSWSWIWLWRHYWRRQWLWWAHCTNWEWDLCLECLLWFTC